MNTVSLVELSLDGNLLKSLPPSISSLSLLQVTKHLRFSLKIVGDGL